VRSRNQTSVVAECQLTANFESIRESLSNGASEERLETLLADWVVPSDRRLPLVFMGWSLRQLLATPFDQLYCTPGVGLKKIEALIQLLRRVADAPSPALRVGVHAAPTQVTVSEPAGIFDPSQIDCSQVSETVWAQWRQKIVEHGLQRETLGRFAPSLQRLSRVIWRTPLGVYTPLTLAEIRAQKTYGEKRVRAVLEVFGALQGVLGPLGPQPHLAVRYQPRLISRLEDWVHDALSRGGQTTDEEIRVSFMNPLIQQIEIDGGDSLADLARHRLGLHGRIETVLNAARRLGFMRARVYQLLNEMATIVSVRWPEGAAAIKRLDAKMRGEKVGAACMAQFDNARDLFFPELRAELPHSSSTDSQSAPRAANQSTPGFYSPDALRQGASPSQLA
jgi:hypothetical protein